jgi:hypothetical protein
MSERVVEAITSGEYAPGEKLSEPDFASKLCVSRIPLREALGRLEGKLVTRTPRLGTRVIERSHSTLEQLFYVREALEGMAARLAAENATTREITALSELLALEQTRCGPDASQYLAPTAKVSTSGSSRRSAASSSRSCCWRQSTIDCAFIEPGPVSTSIGQKRQWQNTTILLPLFSRGIPTERTIRRHIRTSRLNLISRLGLKQPRGGTG